MIITHLNNWSAHYLRYYVFCTGKIICNFSLFAGWLIKIKLEEEKLPDDLLSEQEYNELPEVKDEEHWI